MLEEVVGNRVNRVDVVNLYLAYMLEDNAIHHHCELLGWWTRLGDGRINDEKTIEPSLDMVIQRAHMAVVDMDTKGQRIELIERFTAGNNRCKCSIHITGMNTMKMYSMCHITLIDKMYTNMIACGSSYRWSWHSA